MTQPFYVSSTSSSMSASSAGQRTPYIYTTWYFDLRAETTYGRTFSCSVSNATRVITPVLETATAQD